MERQELVLKIKQLKEEILSLKSQLARGNDVSATETLRQRLNGKILEVDSLMVLEGYYESIDSWEAA